MSCTISQTSPGSSAFHAWTSLLTLEVTKQLLCSLVSPTFACCISSSTMQFSFCITSTSTVYLPLIICLSVPLDKLPEWLCWTRKKKKKANSYRHLRGFRTKQVVPGEKCTPILNQSFRNWFTVWLNKCLQYFFLILSHEDDVVWWVVYPFFLCFCVFSATGSVCAGCS